MRIPRWLLFIAMLIAALLALKPVALDTAEEARGEFVIDLAALHSVAVGAGVLPIAIEVEQVAEFAFPRTIVVAGDGFRMHPMVLLSHRVLWPDQRSLIIDTAVGLSSSLPGAKLDRPAYDRMQRAMASADKIVFTHEHADHVGGVASAPDFAKVASKSVLTREQFTGPTFEQGEFPAGGVAQLKLLDYDGLHPIAPGVVLQKAPGHSTGTQLVYVELANGARYLFVGDIAWSEDNIRLQRGRPALATWVIKEDRGAVAAQVRAFAALPKDVHVVVAHDPVALRRDLAAGLFRKGFSL